MMGACQDLILEGGLIILALSSLTKAHPAGHTPPGTPPLPWASPAEPQPGAWDMMFFVLLKADDPGSLPVPQVLVLPSEIMTSSRNS